MTNRYVFCVRDAQGLATAEPRKRGEEAGAQRSLKQPDRELVSRERPTKKPPAYSFNLFSFQPNTCYLYTNDQY
jgi:hypothetical protein